MSARFAMRDCGVCGRQVLVTAAGRCPRCDRPLIADATPQTVAVRLSDRSDLPHVCVQCGAPTHRVVRVRVRGPAPPPALPDERKQGIPWWVHLLTGHLSLLIPLVTGLSKAVDGASSRSRPRLAVRVRQCRECSRGGPPRGFAPDFESQGLSFEAHPRFADALGRAARDARRAASLRSPPSRGDDEARPVNPS